LGPPTGFLSEIRLVLKGSYGINVVQPSDYPASLVGGGLGISKRFYWGRRISTTFEGDISARGFFIREDRELPGDTGYVTYEAYSWGWMAGGSVDFTLTPDLVVSFKVLHSALAPTREWFATWHHQDGSEDDLMSTSYGPELTLSGLLFGFSVVWSPRKLAFDPWAAIRGRF